jgi:hypothetical protein
VVVGREKFAVNRRTSLYYRALERVSPTWAYVSVFFMLLFTWRDVGGHPAGMCRTLPRPEVSTVSASAKRRSIGPVRCVGGTDYESKIESVRFPGRATHTPAPRESTLSWLCSFLFKLSMASNSTPGP